MNATGPAARDPAGAWYRQPIVWLGAALLAASLAGCIWMIVLGARYADEALPTAGGQVFKVPRARAEAPAAATPAESGQAPTEVPRQ